MGTGLIHGCWFTADIHSLSPGSEDQVSGVRREGRKIRNPKPEH